MEKTIVHPNLSVLDLEHFDISTLVIESRALQGNPLGDTHRRRNPVLVPKGKAPDAGWPVVMMLSGFTGNGPNAFNMKTFEHNLPQTLDQCVARGEAPRAIYVLIDAMTAWGGSQFLNSDGTGRYEDYLLELSGVIHDRFEAAGDPSLWCLMGGSSGGYGALHLTSRYPERFGVCVAIAPDSFFEASLMHDILTALPTIEKVGGVKAVFEELRNGRFMKRKDSHVVLNAIAMGLCYAPDGRGGVHWPVDTKLGTVKPEVWSQWKAHDPLIFLNDRIENVRKLSGIFLDVGTRDQFQLQYGARQINDLFIYARIEHSFTEFEGTHFDIGDRRPDAWKWLKANWG